MRLPISSCLLTLLFVFTSLARAAEPDALATAAQRIADQIAPTPQIDAALYAPAFLKSVPAGQITALCKTLHQQHGQVRSVALESRTGPLAGKFTFNFKDVDMPVTLTLEQDGTHHITGLWFGPTVPRLKSLEEVTQRIGKLPGKTSFQLQRLGDGKVLAAHEAETPLAIGSAFKLYLLAALVQDGAAWDRVVKLDDRYKSLPTGEMQTWPAGAPVTLHTLALKMISQSDNTATDHLLAQIGRARVEKLLPELGLKKPEANVPFLGTREVFRLKADAELRKRFVAATATERAALLEKLLGTPGPTVAQLDLARPVAIDEVEWFASAADLCRVMAWFDKKNDAASLAILAVNPGINVPEKFTYVGFKGGSETGVLNLTWLLKSRDGERYVLSASWNDAANPVDEPKFVGLMRATMDLIEVKTSR